SACPPGGPPTPSARFAGPIRGKVESRVVRAGQPGGGAAELPGVALPAVVAGLAGAGNGPEPPDLLARVLIEGADVTAGSVLTAAEPGDYEVLHDGGRRGDDRALGEVDDLRLPDLLAGLGVERDHVPVEPAHEDLPVGVGHASVVDVAARELVDAGRHIWRGPPQ